MSRGVERERVEGERVERSREVYRGVQREIV